MANAANATAHKTPPPAGVLSPEIKSTPNAAGTAAISENMHTIGTNIDDIQPWIICDIRDHRRCGINEMLREPLHRCSLQPDSKSVQHKETLLKNVFRDVLKLCDKPMKEEMTKHFVDFIDRSSKSEESTYEPFVRAANYALGRLSKLKARGIIPHDDSDDTNALFHHNNMPIRQKHQGVESHRKPDIVVVSHETALEVYEDGRKAAKKNDGSKFEGTSTATMREALEIDKAQRGRRVLYIIIFRKLRPITELSGDEFLRAWWHAVVCHRALWERGVRHRDISPSNLMYYRNFKGKAVGVLNDYDLSSIKNVPTGQERTGTIPFMALDLLEDEPIEGEVEYLYQHDAESFIWVLTWVSLRYEDGKLRSNSRTLDEWLTVDAKGCRQEKSVFLYSVRHNVQPSSSHASKWAIVESSLDTISLHYAVRRKTLEVNEVFEEWFKHVPLEIRSS